MKPNVLIRVDGSPSIGMGHVIRCIALAEMIKNEFRVIFVIQQPVVSITNLISAVTSNIICLPQTQNYKTDVLNFTKHLTTKDIVVLDGYNFTTDYQKRIKATGCKIISIDDLHAWHQVADVIINHADVIESSDYSAEKYTKFYLGARYALLRKTFLNPGEKAPKIDAIKKVFISMGASDINNLTGKYTEAIAEVKDIEEIHLMLGPINLNLESIKLLIEENKRVNVIPHYNITAEELSNLLQSCDLAICSASNISLECCAVGIGLISGFTAENQQGILQGLDNRKALINWGNLNTVTKTDISKQIRELINKPEVFNDLIVNQKLIIDGKSPERILNIFNTLS